MNPEEIGSVSQVDKEGQTETMSTSSWVGNLRLRFQGGQFREVLDLLTKPPLDLLRKGKERAQENDDGQSSQTLKDNIDSSNETRSESTSSDKISGPQTLDLSEEVVGAIPSKPDSVTVEKESDFDLTSVEMIAMQKNLMTLHGITGESMILKNANWKTIMENLLLNKNCELSSSLIKAREVFTAPLWCEEGIIIASGEITSSSTTNSWSKINGEGTRVSASDEFSQRQTVSDAVNEILSHKSSPDNGGHNEAFVKLDKVAGYYFRADSQGQSLLVVDQEKATFLVSNDIPMYCLTSDGIKKGTYDESTKKVVATGEAIELSSIVSHPIELSENQEIEMKNDLIESFPYTTGVNGYEYFEKGYFYDQFQNNYQVRDFMAKPQLSVDEAMFLFGYTQWVRKNFPESGQTFQSMEEKIRTVVSDEQLQAFLNKTKEGKLALTQEQMGQYLKNGKIDLFLP